MILTLIKERNLNAENAINEVMSKWSNEQVISGPILTIPYVKNVYSNFEDEYKEVIETATFLPKILNIEGDITPEKLYRSIYDVVVYQSDIKLNGTFEFPDMIGLR